MIRLAHVINSLSNIGGAENMLINTLRELSSDSSFDITVIVSDRMPEHLKAELDDMGVTCVGLECDKVLSAKTFKRLKKHMRENEYDIIHSHLFPSLYWVGLSSKYCAGAKFIFTEHNTTNTRRKYGFLRPVEKFIYKKYDNIICISEGTAEELRKWQPDTADKLRVIYNGIDLSVPSGINVSKEMFDTPADSPVISMVSRFSKAKDHKTLIDAMQYIREDVHLWLLGGGDTLEQMQKHAAQYQFRDRVHFLGFRKDVKEVISLIDIAVQSSFWEGFGLVAAEAMAMGKPVVASNVSGLSEVVGGTGLLFETGDAVQLAEMVNSLLDDKELYNDTARKCLQKAPMYDIKNMVASYKELYRCVVDGERTA